MPELRTRHTPTPASSTTWSAREPWIVGLAAGNPLTKHDFFFHDAVCGEQNLGYDYRLFRRGSDQSA
jgi:hypothetical protein